MKKIISMFILSMVFILMGCTNGNYLEKPENTNLSFWITDRVEKGALENCTFLPGGFGCNIYLDERYESITDEEGWRMAPLIHVTYTFSGYPDSSNEYAVTHIQITDPAICVYGLTMTSSEEEIASVMLGEHFKENVSDTGQKYYQKKNITFQFSNLSIRINASTTNKKGIVY